MRAFVTGSSDGIGHESAKTLVGLGHEVVLHARNDERAAAARAGVPGASGVVVGDLASLAETRALAQRAEELGPYDVIIHNAGIGGGAAERVATEDGLERIFQVNVLAPYMLTCLMRAPRRLVYLSSGLQANGVVDLEDLQHERGRWNGMQAYSDSKLADVLLAFAVARRWPDVIVNAVDPGWIKTRMGGAAAPDPLPLGAETPVWLATSDAPEATATGRFLKRRQVLEPNPAAGDVLLQDQLLAALGELSGVSLPDRSVPRGDTTRRR